MSGNEANRPARQDPATQQFTGVDSGLPAEIPDSDYHLTREEQATVDALRAGTALLIVLRGPNTGARFLLDDTTAHDLRISTNSLEDVFVQLTSDEEQS